MTARIRFLNVSAEPETGAVKAVRWLGSSTVVRVLRVVLIAEFKKTDLRGVIMISAGKTVALVAYFIVVFTNVPLQDVGVGSQQGIDAAKIE